MDILNGIQYVAIVISNIWALNQINVRVKYGMVWYGILFYLLLFNYLRLRDLIHVVVPFLYIPVSQKGSKSVQYDILQPRVSDKKIGVITNKLACS